MTHRLVIHSDKPHDSDTTQILLDGKPLTGVMSLKVEMAAQYMHKITLVMNANLDADISLDEGEFTIFEAGKEQTV